jgi:HPt (histidine-containing phosphotransfer) domain-containing protein
MTNDPSAIATTTQAIDVPLLLDRCMDDAAVALLVLGSFQENAAESLAEMARFVQQQDAEAVARRAHAMKGTAGAIAATSLMEAASRLEQAACSAMSNEMTGLMQSLSAEMQRCLGSLPDVRKTLGA